MQKVKIKSIDNTIFSRVFLGDKKLERVREVTFNQSVDTVPCFTFETIGLPDIEIDNADICFRFTPETITDAAKVIYHTYKSDSNFRNSFIISVASALKEVPAGTGLYDVANAVADRIIGIE